MRSFVLLLFGLALAVPAAAPLTPAAAVEALLAADRAAAAHAATRPLVEGLTAMFAPDVIVPGPPARLYRGLDEVAAFLRASPDADGRASWTPVRGGVSADGRHGFTFGFMTVTRPTGAASPLKYMAYWVQQADGWRVVGYKRARRADGAADMAPMAPHLPAALVAPRTDAAWLERQRASLVAAERAFSDEAQRIGLGPAFVNHGLPTAVNMGGAASTSYVVGAAAIGRLIGEGSPQPTSPVEWSTDVAVVASSGDLGISFGVIRPHAPPPAGAPPGVPFFTIWARPTPDAPWRYIAE